MIYGIGIDLVKVARISRVLSSVTASGFDPGLH